MVVNKFFTIFALENIFSVLPMTKNGFWHRAYDLYYEGFRNMTLGKTLWAVILIKLFIIFAILKFFFFPNYIDEHASDENKSDFVANELIERAPG